ncbi:phosphoenolpyruvate--protein phosphotransferase [Facilibium subflavum]|uniref:phosphoenolpyruvate--protein phosphotransferase n=1 Tax=Facilibium subflavum TaxID=2219058 RepID=UPI000E65B8DD|nr:phosphoenolpyruvate--protein phosphotransferase [Facilibium subflavum]
MALTLYSPVKGYIVALEQVPDPVFAEKMVGDGFAIEPLDNILYAPVKGKVKTIAKTKHAITIHTEEGYDVLVHLGLETVSLDGQGIEVLVKEGQEVVLDTPILSFDVDFVSSSVKSLITPVIISEYHGDSLKTLTKGIVDKSLPVLKLALEKNLPEPVSKNDAMNTADIFVTRRVKINNKNGLHARPAAVLSNAVKKLDAKVTLYKGDQAATLASPVAIMGLGIEYQDEIDITATGEKAQQAVDIVSDLILQFEDKDSAIEDNAHKADRHAQHESKVQGNTFYGICASKGIAIAKLYRLSPVEFSFDTSADDKTQQLTRLDKAITDYKQALQKKLSHVNDPSSVQMIQAHLELLDDELVRKNTQSLIEQGKTAEYAWDQSIEKAVDILHNTHNSLLSERIADLKDIQKHILYNLTGQSQCKQTFSEPTILYSDEFTLSDVLELDPNVVGLVAAQGGRSSHVAIIANNKNIPLLVQVDSSLTQYFGHEVILDATGQRLIVSPDEQTQADYQRVIDAYHQKLQLAKQEAKYKAITKDGKEIQCYMNIKSSDECADFIASGAEGIGLFRTEFIFYDRDNAPSEDEQFVIYNDILQKTQEKPVIIRTLDAGGDKQIDYLKMPKEENPFLGVRGIRLSLANEALLRTQLRAIIRTENCNAHIMLPMVTNISEFRKVKAIYLEEHQKLKAKVKQPLGIMVEVPSVVMQADIFAKEVDFMSVGTNDLTQYILAMDREHHALTTQLDHLHPAVLKSLQQIQQAAQKYHTKLSVCGMMAADTEALAVLIGLGITHLSMRKNMLAENKALIRQLDAQKCQEIAAKALALEEANEVRQLVKETLMN